MGSHLAWNCRRSSILTCAVHNWRGEMRSELRYIYVIAAIMLLVLTQYSYSQSDSEPDVRRGTIKGNAIDRESKSALNEVNISVVGTEFITNTDFILFLDHIVADRLQLVMVFDIQFFNELIGFVIILDPGFTDIQCIKIQLGEHII